MATTARARARMGSTCFSPAYAMPAQLGADLAQATHGEQMAGEGTLRVVAAPAVELAVHDLAAEGRPRGPAGAGGDGVDVRGEQGRTSAAAAAKDAHHVRPVGEEALSAVDRREEGRVLAQARDLIQHENVHLRPEFGEPLLHEALALRFLAARRVLLGGDAHQRLRRGDQIGGVGLDPGIDLLVHGVLPLCCLRANVPPCDARRVRRPIAYEASWPPSITMVSPVMKAASSEARNAKTEATSSGFPRRPSGRVAA